MLVEERLKIAAAIIEWADDYEESVKRDERALESNFEFRVAAARKLQEIRKLVVDLHKKEGGHNANSRQSKE